MLSRLREVSVAMAEFLSLPPIETQSERPPEKPLQRHPVREAMLRDCLYLIQIQRQGERFRPQLSG